MFRKQTWVVVVATVTVGGSAAWANTADDRDDRLEDKVETRLKADDKLGKIDVDVDNGVVTMNGEVASRAERARAEKLARAEGARRIVNNLEVDLDKAAAAIDERARERKDAVDARADKQKEQIDREATAAKERLERRNATTVSTTPSTASDRTEAERRADAAERRADAAERRAETVERRTGTDSVATNAGDAWVTTKVKTKILADDLLDKSALHVDTDSKGVVTLTGTVPSEAARSRAVEITRTTEGVRQVVDKIVVGAPVK
jgi:osmotically-inducible protein OsmY